MHSQVLSVCLCTSQFFFGSAPIDLDPDPDPTIPVPVLVYISLCHRRAIVRVHAAARVLQPHTSGTSALSYLESPAALYGAWECCDFI